MTNRFDIASKVLDLYGNLKRSSTLTATETAAYDAALKTVTDELNKPATDVQAIVEKAITGLTGLIEKARVDLIVPLLNAK